MPLEIIFMDAGQGDATLLVYPDKSLVLVDCGCKKNGDVVTDGIEEVLARYLPAAGNRIKAVILTHPDGDHYNLVNQLIVQNHIPVDKVFIGGNRAKYAGLTAWFNLLFTQKKLYLFGRNHCTDTIIPFLQYKAGPANEKVDVRILAANVGKDANTNSVVVLVTYRNINIFLMGDSTKTTEDFILTTLGARLDALLKNKTTVLKAGHHGSATSSSPDWIGKLKPKLVFISSDTRSFSGVSLPRSEVIENLIALKSIYDYKDKTYLHSYVQYNGNPFDPYYQRHQAVPTTLGIFTTLHLLTFPYKKSKNKALQNLFKSFGTSWYLDVDKPLPYAVNPACNWDKVNEAY